MADWKRDLEDLCEKITEELSEANRKLDKSNGTMTGGDVEYVDEVGFSVDIFVILKMLAIGIILSIVSGFTSILFILRYDPKQILASRD